MKHTIAILVKDHPGVLARVSSLFNRRRFNIESIAYRCFWKHRGKHNNGSFRAKARDSVL